MKLKQNLGLTFLAISMFIGALGIVTLFELSEITKPLNNEIPETFESLSLSSEMDTHALNIRYYDEVMRQSVRNYAFTGDLVWKDRYYDTVASLDYEIEQAIRKGDSVDAAFFDNVQFANKQLIDIETRSLFAVINGDQTTAIELLDSSEYENYKQVYKMGLQNYADRHELSYEDSILSANQIIDKIAKSTNEKLVSGTTVIMIIVVSVIAASVVLGIYVSNRVVSPLLKLNSAAKQISDGELDVNLPEIGYDEAKELSQSFNQMSASLKKTIELEKKLAIAETQLKSERFAAIGEASSRIAHDLKNPLAAMKAELEIVQHFNRENFDDKTKKRIRNIEDSLDMMYEQIEGMMNFVRATTFDIQSTTVSNLMSAIIKIVVKPENIKMNLPKNDFTLKCDFKKFESVLSNLINNAIQELGKEPGEVTVTFEESQSNVIINVSDSGSGIPEDKLEKIFEPLYTTKNTGTGLGLASCKNIVEQHGGTISAKNNPTTFTIMLPKEPEKSFKQLTNVTH
ncbi:HAMP domain-containing sensor histidine kinase [Nitrosopumilus sp.]|uniref:sensor histidine kinase n=1 Tax=Nitrosopumilus sp. TaxID=2024843 RepID=UPI002636F7DC|nr:HAMP domain-containing sensor histidine kinase [Nitrosopumilus sp.]